MIDTLLHPAAPYSLAASARGRADTTCWFRSGVLTLRSADATATVTQQPDGSLRCRVVGGPAALDAVRFVLAVDLDHRAFLDQAATDPLLRSLVTRQRGYRPLRTFTVTHALVKAVCGQLVQWREAKRLERRILTRLTAGLPPRPVDLTGAGPARLAALGLPPRRADTLVRAVRSSDIERLRYAPTAAIVTRITQQPGLGPWSAGIVAIYGAGRTDHGLVGDLGLLRLCSALAGRPATAADTHLLLRPYGAWAGLASLWLLHHPLARTATPNAAPACRDDAPHAAD
jgi:3-methyladenine DNA glycosylase/8-oxoguanine DNA glycosylase